jgi:hypothetical protein
MQHLAGDSAQAHFRVAARDFARRTRLGYRMALCEIGAHQQRIDFRGIPAQDRILIRVGKNLRLNEIARRQHLRQRAGFARVVERISQNLVRPIVEMLTDSRGVEVDPSFPRHPKMLRQLLQPKSFQLAAGDIVVLRQQPGVDDTPAVNIVATISDHPLGDLHSRGANAHSTTVASQSQIDFMPLRAGLEVFEVEAKQVVTLDNVRVALAHDTHHLGEHDRFIHLSRRKYPLEAARIGDRDRDHTIALASSTGKLEARTRISLDIELHPMQVGELDTHEVSRPGEHQVLLHRIGKD